MYSLKLSTEAEKFLRKSDKHISLRILERLNKLKENPVPSDAVFIGREGEDKVFRYRIGDFRALYKLKDSEKVVLVTRIDKRSRVYER